MVELEHLTRQELIDRCKAKKLKGYSTLNKVELIKHLQKSPEEHKQSKVSRATPVWVEAVKKFNEMHHTGHYVIPKKGTKEHSEVTEIMHKMNSPGQKAKKALDKKEAEAGHLPQLVPTSNKRAPMDEGGKFTFGDFMNGVGQVADVATKVAPLAMLAMGGEKKPKRTRAKATSRAKK